MLLSELLCRIEYSGNFTEREIGSIFCDSRLCSSDSVFVCIRGFAADGHLFARSAYDRGCRAFICEYAPPSLPDDADVLTVPSSREALALLSCAFYRDPSRELFVIGITGTKGKTTSALIIKQLLDGSGIPCGYIGSNGIEWGEELHSTANTTPESCILQKYLRLMADSGMRAVVIEVSSQALALSRVLGVEFDLGVFTNFSPDHIGPGEHSDVDEYFRAKKSFFDGFSGSAVIANADDARTSEMLSGCSARYVTFSVGGLADYSAHGIEQYRDGSGLGVRFVCESGGAGIPVSLGLPGAFNVHNALAAIAVLGEMGISVSRSGGLLSSVRVEGRFEVIGAPSGACFVIDYAHNGVSLTSVLEVLRSYSPRRLICLFGSVGGRTQIRRVQMGMAAARLADLSILTSDNPDFEDPCAIIDDIARCFGDSEGYTCIPDRAEAIRYAFDIAREGDIVLLAGKGHERYQVVCGVNEYFCEREIVLDCIARERLGAGV